MSGRSGLIANGFCRRRPPMRGLFGRIGAIKGPELVPVELAQGSGRQRIGGVMPGSSDVAIIGAGPYRGNDSSFVRPLQDLLSRSAKITILRKAYAAPTF
jgi:hypothetical protein